MSLKHLLFATACGLALTSGVAAATPTARASATIKVYAGPSFRYPVVAKLARDTRVTLNRCTYSGHWCLIAAGGPQGWVLASYLVGSAAKLQATPYKPLVQLHPFFFGHGSWHHHYR